jgi:dinuclear metal center YbgI/SA1388 family protein
MINIRQVTAFLEEKAPLTWQESYDNCGLLIGNDQQTVSNILVCLDVTEDIITEAIQKNCNLIVAHHPLIFGGIKKITGNNFVERIIIKAIQHNIAIYAIHTNLDNISDGVNAQIAAKLDLINTRILAPKPGTLYKLATYCPVASTEQICEALFANGAGHIGNYDKCAFQTKGTGSYRALEGANPTIGKINSQHFEPETKIEVVFPKHRKNQILAALKEAHPYEEVAFEIFELKNELLDVGAGAIGELKNAMSSEAFLAYLKDSMQLVCIRYTAFSKSIKTVAVCGGSGSFLLTDAIRNKADVFITGDFKYHEFFNAENNLMIADIGHYESEKFTIELISKWLSEKFANFAVIFTETNTNPVKYYI